MPNETHDDTPPQSTGRPEDQAGVRMLKAANYLFTRAYHHVTVQSPCIFPDDGPAILACNHTSGLDPLLIQSASPRRLITWMMAKEYYDIRGLGWVFRKVQAIPVERKGRDLAATRSALRDLAAGRILGIFPEGRIELTRELLPFQTGMALMAVKTKVPVYPAYLDGTQRGKEMVPAFFKANRATLRFGPPVELDYSSTSREMLEENTQRIRKAILNLQSQSPGGYNSGVSQQSGL